METALRFRAMGTDVHLVIVDGDPELLEQAQARIEDLELRWSRFLPDTELDRLNHEAGSGTPTALSAITFDLVVSAIDAWRETDGLFDPTILPALVAAGYDRSFDQGPGPSAEQPPDATFTCNDIVVDRDALRVMLPEGCSLDLGGIGKGRAADLVAEEIIDSGTAAGGCVNLGGDLHVFGKAPDGAPGWGVGLEEPDDKEAVMLVVGVADGALATSSTARRRWRAEDGDERHHLIDPRTRAPAITNIRSVSVIAGSAMTAEVHAKASLIAGEPTDDALPMLFVRDDGSRDTFNGFEAYVW
jgi:thiamine biosynthesis lipoprotein